MKKHTMNYLNKLYSYLLLSLISILFVNAHPATIKQDIDWPQFMSQQDMIWEKLPEYWYDSAFLGNGKLGLMIYKEPGKNYLRLKQATAMYMITALKEMYSESLDYLPDILPYILRAK